jgi:hypothetical protein
MDNVYRPKEDRERFLYRYWNGEKEVAADPLVLFKQYAEIQGDLAGSIVVARSAMKDSRQEHDKAVLLVRKLFSILPFDPATGKGLTETESLDVMDHFLDFLDNVKKNSSPTPTSATETSETTPSTLDASQPTSNTSDSGSTGNEKPTEEVGPSLEEPPLPLVP